MQKEERVIPKIVCDIDGVLLDFASELQNRLGRKLDGYEKSVEITRIVHEIHNDDVMLKQYKGSKKYFNLIAEYYDIVLLTSAPEKYNKKRDENLDGYKYKYILNASPDNKLSVIEKINPEYVIEDMPKTIGQISKAGFKVFYPLYHEYTQELNYTNAEGFGSWKRLYEELAEKGKEICLFKRT